jgi:hypothetical protein
MMARDAERGKSGRVLFQIQFSNSQFQSGNFKQPSARRACPVRAKTSIRPSAITRIVWRGPG